MIMNKKSTINNMAMQVRFCRFRDLVLHFRLRMIFGFCGLRLICKIVVTKLIRENERCWSLVIVVVVNLVMFFMM